MGYKCFIKFKKGWNVYYPTVYNEICHCDKFFDKKSADFTALFTNPKKKPTDVVHRLAALPHELTDVKHNLTAEYRAIRLLKVLYKKEIYFKRVFLK